VNQTGNEKHSLGTRIWVLLTPRPMAEAERKYIVTVLYTILIIALLAGGVALAVSVVLGDNGTAAVILAALIANLFMLWLTHRGRLGLPRCLLPLVAFAMTTVLVAGENGLHDEGILGYPLALALAGLLLGKAGVVLYAVLGLAALVGLTWAEITGLLVTPYASDTSYVSAIYTGVPFAFTAALLYIVIDNLTASLQQARQNGRELAQSNSSLEAIRTSLEEQVAERTARAESARQEAEAAWQEASAQAWQTAGLVQLGDAMRGAQDLAGLAGQIIRHLGHYLEAPVGALFVMQDGTLTLAATHACAPERAQFGAGEGLVGQVARDGQPLVVRNLPGDYMTIASGLGDMPPRQVVIWPLLYEEKVLGAVELGLLEELAPAQEQFLARAAERAALALHTAQSRAHIDELLAETQAQARELALREEELSAMNEELQAQAESRMPPAQGR